MRILSVDLGTSNTVAVLSAHGQLPRVVEVDGSATMPSAVFAAEDGSLVVGREAERRARLDPTRFEPNPKRRVDEQMLLLGGRVVPVNEALAAVLRRVLEETSRQLGGEYPDQIRLTHPAEWASVRQNVLLSAARLGGMTGPFVLVPEPVAAAAHFASFPGKHLPTGRALAVYDLGAGTFDVAVVGATENGYTVLAEDGLPDLGGLDVDQALLMHIGREISHRDPQQWQRLLRPESLSDRRKRRALLDDVKAAKEALSRHPQTEVPMPDPFDDVLVTRGELEALVRPSLLRSVELLAETVRLAGLQPSDLAGIYLVGGASRLPLVGSMIGEKLGVVPVSLDQPETAVALGAHHVVYGEQSDEYLRDDSGPTGTNSFTPSGIHSGPHSGSHPVSQSGPHSGSHTGFQSGPHSGPHFVSPSGGNSGSVGGALVPAGANNALAARNENQPTQHGTGRQLQEPAFNFPTYSLRPPEQNRKTAKLTPLIALGVAVLLAAVVGIVLWSTSSSTDTYSAQECAQPGAVDSTGFTGCMRQLAGDIATTSQCSPGMGSGQIAPPSSSNIGVAVSCSAPALAGAQVTYIHGTDSSALAEYTGGLLNSIGGDRIEANWQGNGLQGRYSAAAGASASALVFTVSDRPLAGIIYQVNNSDQPVASTPGAMADYFEQQIQPGE